MWLNQQSISAGHLKSVLEAMSLVEELTANVTIMQESKCWITRRSRIARGRGCRTVADEALDES